MKTYGWFKECFEDARESFDFKLMGLELEVGEKILAAMEEKAISRSKLAELMGVSRAAVSKLLNNPQNLTLKTILKIAMALGCDLDVKIAGEHESAPETDDVEERVSVDCRYDPANHDMTSTPFRIPDDYEFPAFVAFRG